MNDFDAKQAGIDLMASLMALKDPLDQERTAKQQALGQAKQQFKAQVETMRQQIIDLHQKIIPIDDLIRNAAAVKKMKGPAAQRMVESIKKEIEELTNGSSN
jgi:phage shock protein A